MYDCNNYGWSSAYQPYPYQGYQEYPGYYNYYDNGYVSANKCLNLPANISLCYNVGIKPTATLSVGGTTIATGTVNLLTKSVTLKGSVGNITANVTLKVTNIKDLCGNVNGSICRAGKCENLSYNNICLK